MRLIHGDCLEVMRGLEPNSVDAIVTDPPYGLGFMGKQWDALPPGREVFEQCLRVLKPGGHLLAFGGSRTYHRLAVAVEDAGFEIRDQIMWVYGSGFPKSHDVSKGIDKMLGAEREKVRHKPRPETSGTMAGSSDTRPWIEASRERGYHEVDGPTPATPEAAAWAGWGTALKPAHEPIVLARKPLTGTVATNVLEHGTGGLNIDGCRVGLSDGDDPRLGGARAWTTTKKQSGDTVSLPRGTVKSSPQGRWPANLIHDGSDEVLALFPAARSYCTNPATAKSAESNEVSVGGNGVIFFQGAGTKSHRPLYADSGSAARFFYCAKASERDRNEGLEGAGEPELVTTERGVEWVATDLKNTHPTVKPTDLMRYLCRLITPPGGVILDPFMGSGSTGKAARLEGFDFIGIEKEPEYIPIAEVRIAAAIDRTERTKAKLL